MLILEGGLVGFMMGSREAADKYMSRRGNLLKSVCLKPATVLCLTGNVTQGATRVRKYRCFYAPEKTIVANV